MLNSERQFDIKRAECYIKAVEWRYAKTMPNIPHEYTVKSWREDLTEEFVWFIKTIRQYGKERSFFSRTYVYLDIGDYTYWTLGGDIETTKVINRAVIKRRKCKR